MPGKVFEHLNVVAVGEDTFTGSRTGIFIPGVRRIHAVMPTLQDVTNGTAAAETLSCNAVIAADGKSFSLYAWDGAGAAATVPATVSWAAIVSQ